MFTLHAADIFTPSSETHFAIHAITDHELTRPHDHDFCELFAIDRGTIVHVVNGADVHLMRGALVFIRPRDQHYYRPIDRASCTLLNLAFRIELLHEVLAYLDPT